MNKVIHPFDSTTAFLDALLPPDTEICPQNPTNAGLRRFLNSVAPKDNLYLLGHGTAYGLLASHDRLLVKAEHVNMLRRLQNVIGVWCYAASFAEKYGLHGLFTGMIISELGEAQQLEVPTCEEELQVENQRFVQNLAACIAECSLADIPQAMREKEETHSPLTQFNYGHIFYFL